MDHIGLPAAQDPDGQRQRSWIPSPGPGQVDDLDTQVDQLRGVGAVVGAHDADDQHVQAYAARDPGQVDEQRLGAAGLEGVDDVGDP